MGDSAVLAVALMMSSVSSSEDVFRERGKKASISFMGSFLFSICLRFSCFCK